MSQICLYLDEDAGKRSIVEALRNLPYLAGLAKSNIGFFRFT
jgi:hypothetical protein